MTALCEANTCRRPADIDVITASGRTRICERCAAMTELGVALGADVEVGA